MMYFGCTLCEINFQMCLNSWSLFGVDKRDPQIEFLHMLNQPGGSSVKTILHYIQLIYGDGSFRNKLLSAPMASSPGILFNDQIHALNFLSVSQQQHVVVALLYSGFGKQQNYHTFLT